MAKEFDFQALIDSILQNSEEKEPLKGCIIWKKAKTSAPQGKQYARKKNPFPGRPKYTTAHRLMYMAHNRMMDLPRFDEDGCRMEVSHLCHENLCQNIDHLTYESHETNMERHHCKKQGRCTHAHEPHCII